MVVGRLIAFTYFASVCLGQQTHWVPQVEPTVFGDYLFHLIDVDGSAGLDFEEFVQSVMTYCNFGKEDILKLSLIHI